MASLPTRCPPHRAHESTTPPAPQVLWCSGGGDIGAMLLGASVWGVGTPPLPGFVFGRCPDRPKCPVQVDDGFTLSYPLS